MSEPKFKAKDNQVDYTNLRYAPVVNTVVTNAGKILLAKRSPDMRLYPSCWNGISGFLDDGKSIEEKVAEELHDELSISADDITKIERGSLLIQEAPEYNKTWLVVPVLAEIKTAKFKLDWEATEARWFTYDEVKKLELMPGFIAVLAQFFR